MQKCTNRSSPPPNQFEHWSDRNGASETWVFFHIVENMPMYILSFTSCCCLRIGWDWVYKVAMLYLLPCCYFAKYWKWMNVTLMFRTLLPGLRRIIEKKKKRYIAKVQVIHHCLKENSSCLLWTIVGLCQRHPHYQTRKPRCPLMEIRSQHFRDRCSTRWWIFFSISKARRLKGSKIRRKKRGAGRREI